jgi:hypothetical protein
MTSPVSSLEAIEKAPNRIQGMVRSIDQYRNGDPKAVADGSYAQVLYALTDYKHDVLVLWDFAISVAPKAEAYEREIAELREALKPFAECCPEWDGEPDSLHVFFEWNDECAPVPSLPVADFRRARAALQSSETTGEK